MSSYPEIPCSSVRFIAGKEYNVRRFGLNGVVFEEELHPLPTIKVIKTFNDGGRII